MTKSLYLFIIVFCMFVVGILSQELLADSGVVSQRLNGIEAAINACKPDSAYKDDVYGLIVVKDALRSLKEGSGGIGACLVDEKTGKVVARGRNRQYSPYFRSDLHAEMDLLTRYEDWLRKKTGTTSGKATNPRKCENIVLISSVEPCPMCLARIINSGIEKMYYVTPDPEGGMVTHMDCLPPFWKRFAADRDFREASCSPEIRKIAKDLFDYSMRVWSKNKKNKLAVVK